MRELCPTAERPHGGQPDREKADRDRQHRKGVSEKPIRRESGSAKCPGSRRLQGGRQLRAVALGRAAPQQGERQERRERHHVRVDLTEIIKCSLAHAPEQRAELRRVSCRDGAVKLTAIQAPRSRHAYRPTESRTRDSTRRRLQSSAANEARARPARRLP